MLGEQATGKFSGRRIRTTELFYEDLRCLAGVEILSAGEHIRGSVTVLRPCVDTYVRLGNGHQTGHSMWLELMEALAYNLSTCIFRCLYERTADETEVVKYPRVATLQLKEQMPSKCLQSAFLQNSLQHSISTVGKYTIYSVPKTDSPLPRYHGRVFVELEHLAAIRAHGQLVLLYGEPT